MHTNICIHTDTQTYVYTHTDTHTYVHTNTHTHTHTTIPHNMAHQVDVPKIDVLTTKILLYKNIITYTIASHYKTFNTVPPQLNIMRNIQYTIYNIQNYAGGHSSN